MSVLKLENVSFSYRVDTHEIPVLNEVSFEIQAGEMVAVRGPSGSGKSTLFYLIGGLLRPKSGRIFLGMQELGALSEDALSKARSTRIGFVFQQFHLLPKASVLENILLPSRYAEGLPHGRTAESTWVSRARKLAGDLGIGDRLNHLPNQLSGGQQQRVAIARALLHDADLILADEPTGNLDSKAASQILEILRELNRRGKTVLIITHDAEVAGQCGRVIEVRDGHVVSVTQGAPPSSEGKPVEAGSSTLEQPGGRSGIRLGGFLVKLPQLGLGFQMALSNLRRNRLRTVLTMSGVTIGVAAVLAMVTLGQFTKRKILDSYTELGAHSMMFYGYPNWQLRAQDRVGVVFQSFDWNKDLLAMRRVFPQIQAMSPLLMSWDGQASFAGRVVESDVRVMGVGHEALSMTNRELLMGKNFYPIHVDRRSPVCIIGFEIATRLFRGISPLGQTLQMKVREERFACRVLGVLKNSTSNKEWMKPNLQILLPYTFFQISSGNWWSSQIRQVLLQVRPDSDIVRVGRGIRYFFERKYGPSGEFRVDSDSVLLAQMNKFLTLFQVLLGAIAFVSLGVGAIGITNMMLVSVSERFREIGLRKAVGATAQAIRAQFLSESLLVCVLAGLAGLGLGVAIYQTLIFGASKLVPKLQYEWVFEPWAVGMALLSIVLVGVLSGLFPALKAERLPVIDALRSE